MTKFSARQPYSDEAKEHNDNINKALKNRIWNLFYREDITNKSKTRLKNSFKSGALIEDALLDKVGLLVVDGGLKTNRLREHLLNSERYQVFDFVEAHISVLSGKEKSVRIKQYNELFEYEGIKFRIVNELVCPLYNKTEVATIEAALATGFDSVNQHLSKALSYFSDKKQPDYENSIKESISAVEAMCCIINGKNATLNKAIKHLKENGTHIHPAMENAFVSLYGYTSDEKGIRHAGMDFVNAPMEDAKYMLISCSAFINYLVEKWSKCDS